MHAFVKSFNRAYYLDRALRTIRDRFHGDVTVVVLDDGTPERYLAKIRDEHPGVEVWRSNMYDWKAERIERGVIEPVDRQRWVVPARFWAESVARGGRYVAILEDDIWLTRDVDAGRLEALADAHRLALVKLMWMGNRSWGLPGRPVGSVAPSGEGLDVVQYRPGVGALDRLLLRYPKLRHTLGRFAGRGYFTGLFTRPYRVYQVAGAVFERDYWLRIWEGAEDAIDETVQLTRALEAARTPGLGFARTSEEACATSFLTSTNNLVQRSNIDIMDVNRVLNDAWLDGRLDPMNGYPRDLDVARVADLLTDAGLDAREWRLWSERFAKMYNDLGFSV